MLQTGSGAEFDEEVAEIRSAVVCEVNVVKEMLLYMTKEGLSIKNKTGFVALHIAMRQCHEGTIKLPSL